MNADLSCCQSSKNSPKNIKITNLYGASDRNRDLVENQSFSEKPQESEISWIKEQLKNIQAQILLQNEGTTQNIGQKQINEDFQNKLQAQIQKIHQEMDAKISQRLKEFEIGLEIKIQQMIKQEKINERNQEILSSVFQKIQPSKDAQNHKVNDIKINKTPSSKRGSASRASSGRTSVVSGQPSVASSIEKTARQSQKNIKNKVKMSLNKAFDNNFNPRIGLQNKIQYKTYQKPEKQEKTKSKDIEKLKTIEEPKVNISVLKYNKDIQLVEQAKSPSVSSRCARNGRKQKFKVRSNSKNSSVTPRANTFVNVFKKEELFQFEPRRDLVMMDQDDPIAVAFYLRKKHSGYLTGRMVRATTTTKKDYFKMNLVQKFSQSKRIDMDEENPSLDENPDYYHFKMPKTRKSYITKERTQSSDMPLHDWLASANTGRRSVLEAEKSFNSQTILIGNMKDM